MRVFYSVVVDGEAIWDGHAAQAPACGDEVLIDGQWYRVHARRWQTAGDSLGPEAARMWDVGETDLVCVELICRPDAEGG